MSEDLDSINHIVRLTGRQIKEIAVASQTYLKEVVYIRENSISNNNLSPEDMLELDITIASLQNRIRIFLQLYYAGTNRH
jgi:hypothetical protein